MMKIKYIISAFLFVSIFHFSIGQENQKDSAKFDFQTIISFGRLSNLTQNYENGMSFGLSYFGVKIRPSGLTTKLGFDLNIQAFDNGKNMTFNRDSLWFTGYTKPHKIGAFNNGIVNVQVGLPMSLGYSTYTRNSKDRVEVNVGLTSYYTWSDFTETYDDVEQGAKYTQSNNTNISFIQNKINFNSTASVNYILNQNWIFGINASYALNSLYKTKYMNLHPLSIGVSLGFNIKNVNKK